MHINGYVPCSHNMKTKSGIHLENLNHYFFFNPFSAPSVQDDKSEDTLLHPIHGIAHLSPMKIWECMAEEPVPRISNFWSFF